MTLRNIALSVMAAGLLIGLWQWQVDNVMRSVASAQAGAEAQARGAVSFGYSYQPAPSADRAMGMAFAFLLCGLGCFVYHVAMQTEPVDGAKDETVLSTPGVDERPS